MHLRLALLALLTAHPMTGFDLMRQFDKSVGYMWNAPHTQIYPELRRLNEAGLIEGEEVARGARGKKTLYRVTEAGKAQLREWLNTVEEPKPQRDPYRLRAAYLEWADPAAARAQLKAHEKYFSEALGQYQRIEKAILDRTLPLLIARLEHTPTEMHESTVAFKAFAYAGLIRQARNEVEWAQDGLALLRRLHPELHQDEDLTDGSESST